MKNSIILTEKVCGKPSDACEYDGMKIQTQFVEYFVTMYLFMKEKKIHFPLQKK